MTRFYIMYVVAKKHETFDTHYSSGIALVFEILGDWGERRLPGQPRVAEHMENCGAIHHPEFIITTGDNFYPRVQYL